MTAAYRSFAAISLVIGCAESGHDQPVSVHDLLSLQSLLCIGQASATFVPGFTNTPQPITATFLHQFGTSAPTVGACVSVGALISGGVLSSQRVLTISCTEILQPAPALTLTYQWSNNTSSTITYTTQLNNRAASETTITWLGTVDAGFGARHAASESFVVLNTDLDACFTTGVTSLSGPATIEILPL